MVLKRQISRVASKGFEELQESYADSVQMNRMRWRWTNKFDTGG